MRLRKDLSHFVYECTPLEVGHMANLPTVNEMGKEIIYFIFQTGPLDNLHAGGNTISIEGR